VANSLAVRRAGRKPNRPIAAFGPIGPSGRAVGPLAVEARPVYGRLMDIPRTRSASAILVRRIRPGDRDALRSFYATLSEESRRTRFLGPTIGIGADQSTWFCTPDHAHREGFVAVSGPGPIPERILGHVCVEPEGTATAEIAVAVADDVQGRGIGRRLVEAAVARAREHGIGTLTATMLAGNPAIQRLLSGLGLPSSAQPVGAGIIEIRIEIGAGGRAAA
jgi:GNAT superfamily N-acetyltransferase